MLVDNGSIQFLCKMESMIVMNNEKKANQKNPRRSPAYRNCRKSGGRLRWVYEHLQITNLHNFSRVSLPDNGEHVARRGRKATGQGWALIAGLPKEQTLKRLCLSQDVRAY